MSTKKVEKILIKVIGHGKDATKCQWGIFRGDCPLAESELKDGVKSARNVYLIAKAAKAYAEKHNLKNSRMVDDIVADKNLAALSDKAKALSGERAEAKKAADEILKKLLDEAEEGARAEYRKAWRAAMDDVENRSKAVKDAQAELIAACDAWFQKRIEAQRVAK